MGADRIQYQGGDDGLSGWVRDPREVTSVFGSVLREEIKGEPDHCCY